MPSGGWASIALHAAAAAGFFFVLQRFLMRAELETSLVWALAGAAGAAWLAWHQARR